MSDVMSKIFAFDMSFDMSLGTVCSRVPLLCEEENTCEVRKGIKIVLKNTFTVLVFLFSIFLSQLQ
jgi:hypothetical protein